VLGAFAVAVTAVRLVLPVLAHRVSQVQVLRGAMWIASNLSNVASWLRARRAMMFASRVCTSRREALLGPVQTKAGPSSAAHSFRLIQA
jgi:hypothetical protein